MPVFPNIKSKAIGKNVTSAFLDYDSMNNGVLFIDAYYDGHQSRASMAIVCIYNDGENIYLVQTGGIAPYCPLITNVTIINARVTLTLVHSSTEMGGGIRSIYFGN